MNNQTFRYLFREVAADSSYSCRKLGYTPHFDFNNLIVFVIGFVIVFLLVLLAFMAQIQSEIFDVGTEFADFTKGRRDIGGIVSFIGLTRDFSGDNKVYRLELEHYPGMTERQLTAIEQQAIEKFSLHSAKIIHRYGQLLPGDPIVLVMAAAAHRAAAFEGCWFMIDWLKTHAPFWKCEHRSDGSHWLDAKPSDDLAASRWM